jgi:hypothetical protein
MKKGTVIVVVATAAVGVVYLAFSYVLSAGDQTRAGVRVARALGIRHDGSERRPKPRHRA